MRVLMRALLSYWRRRPLALATLILGLALATALWTGVQAINAEARKSYDDAAETLGGGGLEVLVKPNGTISEAEFAALRRAGWLVSPVIDGWITGDQGRVRVLGIDPFTLPPTASASQSVSIGTLTDMVGPLGALVANPTTAKRLKAMGLPVIEDDAVSPGLALADIALAGRLTDATGFSRLFVAPIQPLRQAPLDQIASDLERQQPEISNDLARLTDSFHLNLTAFGLLSFAVGLFIVHGAVGLAIEQRRTMFRTLRALGASVTSLILLLIIELFLFAMAAGTIGIFLGYVIAALLLPDVAATLRGLYGASLEGVLTLSPIWWLGGFGIAIAGTAFSALSGLVKVARMPPLQPAKPRAWAMVSQRTTKWQLGTSALFLAAALVAFLIGGGLVGGFVLLGSFLLAAALALPALLGFVITLISQRAKGPLATWFWADTRQQLPGLSLALMALMLAVAANIGVGTMVSSFRATFTGWLDQRLVSDLYVSVENDAEYARMQSLAQANGLTVLPIWHVERQILGAPADIYGVVDHPVYRENWPLLSAQANMWDTLFESGGALINEQLARRENLSVGDPLPLSTGQTVQILGVYGDYGNPIGQIIRPNSAVIADYPDLDRSDFGVLTPDIPATKALLMDQLDWEESRIIDQAALKAFSLQIFERTFAVTGALNVLTLAVAAFAILTALLTLASMRLPQLAPAWAMGIERRRLAQIELIRAVVLALLTFLIALPVGLALAWVLLAVINVEAFGWRLPIKLFPLDWVWLAMAALAAAGIAGGWPARQLAKGPPAKLMRVFTQER